MVLLAPIFNGRFCIPLGIVSWNMHMVVEPGIKEMAPLFVIFDRHMLIPHHLTEVLLMPKEVLNTPTYKMESSALPLLTDPYLSARN